jgi:integrase
MTLGTYPSTSLSEARTRAIEAKGEIERGNDPRSTKVSLTLKAVCEEYLKRDGKKLRTKDWREKVLARLVYPKLGLRPIGDIRRSDIVRLLDRVEDQSGPVMADRTLAIVRKIMNWHASRSDDFRSPIVRGMARTKPKERARERTLTDDELRVVWEAAGEGVFGAYIRFLLLTAARRGEAAQAQWVEVSGADWTIPGARYKTGRDLLIPLPVMAQKLLAGIAPVEGCDFIFTTDGKTGIGGFSKFKRQFDARVLAVLRKQDRKTKPFANWTLHDLRRTARSLMGRAGVPADHAERALGHTMDTIRGTYDRFGYRDAKAQAFEALAGQIDRILNPRENVVLIGAAR